MSMRPVGFEPTVSAGKRPQTYALDRTATGIGVRHFRPVINEGSNCGKRFKPWVSELTIRPLDAETLSVKWKHLYLQRIWIKRWLLTVETSGVTVQVLRCGIPVVLSKNKNKLNNTYVYRHKHNYIPCSTFIITKLQLHVSAINVGHLQVVHEALNDKLHLHVSGKFTLTRRYSLSLSASCTTWRWPTLMAETCSFNLVIVNVLQGI